MKTCRIIPVVIRELSTFVSNITDKWEVDVVIRWFRPFLHNKLGEWKQSNRTKFSWYALSCL